MATMLLSYHKEQIAIVCTTRVQCKLNSLYGEILQGDIQSATKWLWIFKGSWEQVSWVGGLLMTIWMTIYGNVGIKTPWTCKPCRLHNRWWLLSFLKSLKNRYTLVCRNPAVCTRGWMYTRAGAMYMFQTYLQFNHIYFRCKVGRRDAVFGFLNGQYVMKYAWSAVEWRGLEAW